MKECQNPHQQSWPTLRYATDHSTLRLLFNQNYATELRYILFYVILYYVTE